VLWELALAALALGIALIVIVPVLWLVNIGFHAGVYRLAIATAVAGVLLLIYHVRVRPGLRAATGGAEAEYVSRHATDERPPASPGAFRVWRGVPISLLRATVHSTQNAAGQPLAQALCAHVRRHAENNPTLAWAFSRVGGSGFLLLREPERAGEPTLDLDVALLESRTNELTFYHLWSDTNLNGAESIVASATVVMARAISGTERQLQERAVALAQEITAISDLAGVEVMMSETLATEPPWLLWLVAGRTRSVQRQVYLKLDRSALAGLAVIADQYSLLACDSPGMAVPSATPPVPGSLAR
jgi:hypothetical protein